MPISHPHVYHLFDTCSVAHLQGLRDPHAKVRWAACQALGQMCTDLGPNIQEEQHQNILPGLMAVMDDFGEPRVQVGPLAETRPVLSGRAVGQPHPPCSRAPAPACMC